MADFFEMISKIRMFCWTWIKNLTNFLIFCTLFFGILCTFIFFYFSHEFSMLFCRGISLLGMICLCICSGILIITICGQTNNGAFDQTYPVSMSIKLFVFVISVVSISGYYLRIPYTYVLYEYDFALHYSHFWLMIFSDTFYVVSIIVYLLTQLFYLWFYFPTLGFFENLNQKYNKFIFGFTLIINFWQKWLYETLIAKEEICEELSKYNRSCIGHQHYDKNFSMMSEVEQEAYHLMQMISPLSYSCTMELLVVYLIVLCYCKPHNDTNKFKYTNKLFSFSIAPKIVIALKLLMFFVLVLVVLCMTGKLVTLFHDESQPRLIENIFYHWMKLTSLIGACTVYCALFFIYRDVKPRADENSKKRKSSCCFTGFEIFGLCSSASEPDLLILQVTWWITFMISFTKIILQSFDYIHDGLIDTEKLLFSIIPEIISLISFAFNFKLINGFLSCDRKTFEQLRNNRFTTHYMIPYQIIRCFIRATNRFIVILDPEVSLLAHDKIDQWITLLNAAYPFSPLMNITSALCWAHVMEKFFATGSNKTMKERRNSMEW